MHAKDMLTTFLLGSCCLGLAVYLWPMSNSEVVTHLKVERIVRGAHNSATNPGPGRVVTIAVHNSHSWRDSPIRLWAGCEVAGHSPDMGDYANKFELFQAFGQKTLGADGREQWIPAGRTANIDFDTSAGTPEHDMRNGETVTGPCVIGATKEQAMALGGYREGDQQGQWTRLTAKGKLLGAKEGWRGQ